MSRRKIEEYTPTNILHYLRSFNLQSPPVQTKYSIYIVFSTPFLKEDNSQGKKYKYLWRFQDQKTWEKANNQDNHIFQYSVRAIMPRGTNYPPELVIDALLNYPLI
ncbi:hypothetical protein V6Z11_D13G099500 [Gossypium hirsutum]|uniref:Uncharacterized protein n=1 Tax=Gossypium tomentosum TaxID=34277 RepID=A0A5D2HWG0_GOSTO|nr:hypothetical protein ES332_D13G104100v1 [Gossypium tomentosum]